MPVPCQIIKPLCLVVGVEKHTALGLSPVGVPAPNPATIWMSLFTIYNFIGDAKSETVFSSAQSGFIKRGHDSKYMRPHLTVFAPPLPSVVPIPVDLGLMAVVIAFGSAKTAWGPYSIKASIGGEAQNPAVNFLPPFLFLGAANFMVCSSPTSMPNVFNIQPPNTVLAGMSVGDVAGNLISTLLDLVLSKVLDKLMDWGPVKEIVEELSGQVGARLSGALRNILSERMMKSLTRQFIEEAEEGAEKEAEDAVTRPITKLVQTGAGKLTEYVVGKLGASSVVDGAGDKVNEAFGEEGGEDAGEKDGEAAGGKNVEDGGAEGASGLAGTKGLETTDGGRPGGGEGEHE